MPLTPKDISVIRMIFREELKRCYSISTVSVPAVATIAGQPALPAPATVQWSNAKCAPAAPVESVYVVGSDPFQRTMTESEYNEYLSGLTQ